MIIFFALLLCYSYEASENYNRSSDLLNNEKILNSQQLILLNNYPAEEHLVQTEDGYIVTLFRIPRKGPPVLLVHGIGDSSDCWLVLGRESSLAFLLYDVGFDVWIYNSRGNKYSKNHINLPPNKKYWRFSFEEMGTKDLPSVIDYILAASKTRDLTYIGFSQGSTIFLIMCSLRPEYNEKISHSVLLAPVTWLHNSKHPVLGTLAKNLPMWRNLIDDLGIYEVFSSNALQNRLHAELCNSTNSYNSLCAMEYFLSYGLTNMSHISPDKFPIVASHIPAGASSFSYLHFIQNYIQKRFQRFDFKYWTAKRSNLRNLPEYDMSAVTATISIFASASDWFTGEKDIKRLRNILTTVTNYVNLSETLQFSHIEFVYGSRAKTLIYLPVINILSKLHNIDI